MQPLEGWPLTNRQHLSAKTAEIAPAQLQRYQLWHDHGAEILHAAPGHLTVVYLPRRSTNAEALQRMQLRVVLSLRVLIDELEALITDSVVACA